MVLVIQTPEQRLLAANMMRRIDDAIFPLSPLLTFRRNEIMEDRYKMALEAIATMYVSSLHEKRVDKIMQEIALQALKTPSNTSFIDDAIDKAEGV